MPPVINPECCVGCGTCADICAMDVFSHIRDGQPPRVLHPEECWHCTACKTDCPHHAIRLRLPLPYRLLWIESTHLHSENRAEASYAEDLPSA